MSWRGVPKNKEEYMVLFADEWNTLVDAVDELYVYGPGSIGRDLTPTQDGKFDIGKENKKFKNVYALYGEFSNDVKVQGRRVLKDLDPIYLADLFHDAYLKIINAVKQAIAQSIFYAYLIGQKQTLDVDTLKTEEGDSWFIDTSIESSPKLLVSPSLGKRLATRSWSIQTDSSAGEIFIRYANTLKVIGWLPASKYTQAGKDRIIIRGEKNESIFAYWQDLSTGAKILIQLAWKEE